jgi:hypothetical protein
MYTAVFELAIPVIELPPTHTIDLGATVIGIWYLLKASSSPSFLIVQAFF